MNQVTLSTSRIATNWHAFAVFQPGASNGIARQARRIAGAKRYRSIFVHEGDGFAEGANPSYALLPAIIARRASDSEKIPHGNEMTRSANFGHGPPFLLPWLSYMRDLPTEPADSLRG